MTLISIHAPVWGATKGGEEMARRAKFQSTHPYGVRHTNRVQSKQHENFNPRTRMGCDGGAIGGALSGGIFQSTHPYGVRHNMVYIAKGFDRFQSTHPYGVRLCTKVNFFIIFFNFNPRTRMGCDIVIHGTASTRLISIHAPVWGATSIISIFFF